jgi:arginine/serine-rich splicing factor 4/5/6
MPSSTKNC